MDGNNPFPEKRGLHSGKTVDDQYRIGSLLCQDALGGLYECEDADNEEVVIRLFSGGIIIASSSNSLPLHPNILVPAQVSPKGKLPRYAVFESFVKSTLREWIKTRVHSTADDLIAVMLQLTNAVHAVHESGRPLGNLCPETIFIGEDFMGKLEIYVVDAEISFAASSMVQKPYMPAEQLEGAQPTISGDIWSLGAMMYEALYRRKAYTGKNKKELLAQIKSEPLGFSTFKKVPASFIGIIQKCLSSDPKTRYADALALGGDLLTLQQQLGKDVSSEAVQKAIRDSIPPARRISAAPHKKERSSRISLAPARTHRRIKPQIEPVPPQKLPARKREKAIPATEDRPVASKRLSVPPKGAAVPRKSAFPPPAKRAGSVHPFAAKSSATAITATMDPFADISKPAAGNELLWPDDEKKKSAPEHPPKPVSQKKQTVAIQPQISRPSAPAQSVADRRSPDQAPPPLPPTVSVIPPVVSAALPKISRPPVPGRESQPIEHSNKRVRKQTVMGIPAAPAAPKPPMSPAPPAENLTQAPPPAEEPEHDSWLFLPDEEEQTLPARPDALSSMLTPAADNLFDNISMNEFDLPGDPAENRPLPGSPLQQAPMEDTPHPGLLSDESQQQWEHRHIEKRSRWVSQLRETLHQLTAAVPVKYLPIVRTALRSAADRMSILYRRTVAASPELKQRITHILIQMRSQILRPGKDRKRLIIVAAIAIALIAGISIALSTGSTPEQSAIGASEQAQTSSVSRPADATDDAHSLQQPQDAPHTETRNTDVPRVTPSGNEKNTGIVRPISSAAPLKDNYNRSSRYRKTPKYKRRESYRNSDTEADEDEKYRDRTLTRGKEEIKGESATVKPVKSKKSKDVAKRNARLKKNGEEQVSSAPKGHKKKSGIKKKKAGKQRKKKNKAPPKSGWATNPFGG